MAICLCTKVSPRAFLILFFSSRLLFRRLAIMRFFSDFFVFRTRQRKKDTAERSKRERERKKERGYGSTWKGANNGTHDLRRVPEEHTDFKCFSPILLPPSPPIVWSERYRTGTLFAARIVRLAGTSVRKPMLTHGGLLWIYGMPQMHSVGSIENKLERNRSSRYRDRTNGGICKNFLDERALMKMILFSFNRSVYAHKNIYFDHLFIEIVSKTNILITNQQRN